jgi:predicted NBD/HSP70 family sugar kinase
MTIRIGADIGGTTMCVGAFPEEGGLTVSPLDVVTIAVTRDFNVDTTALIEAILQFVAKFGPASGIGADVAGLLDPQRDMLLGAGNLPNYARKPLRETIAAGTGINRVSLGNDTEGHALYEALTNPGLKGRDCVMVEIGTGIGIARIAWINGVPYSFPTEGAHLKYYGPVRVPNPHKCGCGSLHCIERLSSGDGILQRFGGYDLKDEEWRDIAHYQAVGIAGALAFNPVQTVVYGGGVAEKQPLLIRRFRSALELELIDGLSGLVDVIPAKTTKHEGAVGGLALLERGA